MWRTRGEAIKKRYRRGKLDQFFNDLVKKKKNVYYGRSIKNILEESKPGGKIS